MRCTVKKTVSDIIARGNHYCIGLKGNQGTLLRQAQACAATQPPLTRHYDVLDTSHGRCVERCVEVFAAPPALAATWEGLAAFARVERSGSRDGQCFQHHSWAILSQPLEAQRVSALIRGHRSCIENRLHWVKDVVQQEDASLICAPQPAQLMALLRTWALSAFRKAGHQSITKALRLFRHDMPKLISFL